MPSSKVISISGKDYKTLLSIKTGLEKFRKKPVSFADVVSYLIEATTIPEIPPEKDEEIIRKLEKLRSAVRKRMEKSGEV